MASKNSVFWPAKMYWIFRDINLVFPLIFDISRGFILFHSSAEELTPRYLTVHFAVPLKRGVEFCSKCIYPGLLTSHIICDVNAQYKSFPRRSLITGKWRGWNAEYHSLTLHFIPYGCHHHHLEKGGDPNKSQQYKNSSAHLYFVKTSMSRLL